MPIASRPTSAWCARSSSSEYPRDYLGSVPVFLSSDLTHATGLWAAHQYRRPERLHPRPPCAAVVQGGRGPASARIPGHAVHRPQYRHGGPSRQDPCDQYLQFGAGRRPARGACDRCPAWRAPRDRHRHGRYLVRHRLGQRWPARLRTGAGRRGLPLQPADDGDPCARCRRGLDRARGRRHACRSAHSRPAQRPDPPVLDSAAPNRR